MEHKQSDDALNEIIRASMSLESAPTPELNCQLKAKLYQREAALRQTAPTHAIPLWFLPMLFNFVTFALFALLALFTISNPLLAKLVAGFCGYISLVGVFLTAIGVKRTGMKKALTLRIQKRGVLT